MGYFTMPITHAKMTYGGVLLEGGTLTDYCQAMYHLDDFLSTETQCNACADDPKCQYAPLNGGCISIYAYVPDFGCPRQAISPEIKLYSRTGSAAAADGIYENSTRVVRVKLTDKLDGEDFVMTCPCNVQYRLHLVVYDAQTMEQVYMTSDIAPRLDHPYTFIDVPCTVPGRKYYYYVYNCYHQKDAGGSWDDCSRPAIAIDITDYSPPSPPPFPPPFPPPPPIVPPPAPPPFPPPSTPKPSPPPMPPAPPAPPPSPPSPPAPPPGPSPPPAPPPFSPPSPGPPPSTPPPSPPPSPPPVPPPAQLGRVILPMQATWVDGVVRRDRRKRD